MNRPHPKCAKANVLLNATRSHTLRKEAEQNGLKERSTKNEYRSERRKKQTDSL